MGHDQGHREGAQAVQLRPSPAPAPTAVRCSSRCRIRWARSASMAERGSGTVRRDLSVSGSSSCSPWDVRRRPRATDLCRDGRPAAARDSSVPASWTPIAFVASEPAAWNSSRTRSSSSCRSSSPSTGPGRAVSRSGPWVALRCGITCGGRLAHREGRHGAFRSPPESPLLPSQIGGRPLLCVSCTRNAWRHDIFCTRRVTNRDSQFDEKAGSRIGLTPSGRRLRILGYGSGPPAA